MKIGFFDGFLGAGLSVRFKGPIFRRISKASNLSYILRSVFFFDIFFAKSYHVGVFVTDAFHDDGIQGGVSFRAASREFTRFLGHFVGTVDQVLLGRNQDVQNVIWRCSSIIFRAKRSKMLVCVKFRTVVGSTGISVSIGRFRIAPVFKYASYIFIQSSTPGIAMRLAGSNSSV